ncbi:MAG: hypothetical protein IT305_28330 [Chloroflexi bacterium]|nr:hypothetical protein [Chloroflexota bacterium]
MSGWEMREDRLDDLLRDALVVDPPPAVRASLLAAVLDASAMPAAMPLPVPLAAPLAHSLAQPNVARTPDAPGPSPLVYALLGALLALYLGLLTSFGGLLGDGNWLVVLAQQSVLAVGLIGGVGNVLLTGLPGIDPESLAPWLALVPVVWFLFERDRAESRLRS